MKKLKIPKKIKTLPKKRTYFVLREEEKEKGKTETTEIYKDTKPPFRLDHRDFICDELLRKYGPGRYVIKSVDSKKKEIVHFSGEVKHPSKGKVWSKRERFLYTQIRRPERRLKVVTFIYIGVIWLVLLALFFNGIFTMNSGLIITTAIAMAVMLILSALFMSIAFYETD